MLAHAGARRRNDRHHDPGFAQDRHSGSHAEELSLFTPIVGEQVLQAPSSGPNRMDRRLRRQRTLMTSEKLPISRRRPGNALRQSSEVLRADDRARYNTRQRCFAVEGKNHYILTTTNGVAIRCRRKHPDGLAGRVSQFSNCWICFPTMKPPRHGSKRKVGRMAGFARTEDRPTPAQRRTASPCHIAAGIVGSTSPLSTALSCSPARSASKNGQSPSASCTSCAAASRTPPAWRYTGRSASARPPRDT